jgi:hypothetical protein
MDKKDKKELTLGEKALNWAKAIGIILPLVGAGVVSVLGWFKSDAAETGVDSLVLQLSERVAKQEKVINAQSEKLEKMARRMIFFQGHQAGFSAGKLYVKVEETEKQLAQCVAKQAQRGQVTKNELESMIGAAMKRRSKPSTSGSSKVQSIPRIKSKPFNKGEK